MNGTEVTAFQSISTFVNSPSAHGMAPGVVSIDNASCRARKRPRTASIPPPVNSHTSCAPSTSSRIAKPNKTKSSGPKSSSPPSSLAVASLGKRQNTATDADVVTSIAAAAAAIAASAPADEFGTFRHQNPETKWDPPIPSASFRYGEEFVVPNTSSVTRDHFILSSNPSLTQGPGQNVYDWPCDNLDTSTSNNLCRSMFHPSPYLTTHHHVPQENPLTNDYLTDYQNFTANTRSVHPLPVSSHLNCAISPTMAMRFEPPLGTHNTVAYHIRPEENGMEDIQNGWSLLINDGLPREDANPVDYDTLEQIPNPPDGIASAVFKNDAWEQLNLPHVDNVAVDETRSPSQPEKRSRSRLSMENRAKTGKTRKLKACIRCRMQKIRCNPDLENPEGSDCLTCQNINLESKKVIHRLPCLRWKLGEVVMFRDGGLGLTTRWHGLKMKDLGPRDWTYPNDPPRKIVVTIGCKRQPIELLVRRFKLIHGDITHKGWIDKNGVQRRIEIPPYALASIHETVKQYKKYVFCNARIAIDEYAHKEGVDPLVQKTYAAALEYAIELEQHPSPANGDDVNPSVFLNQYFSLWFAVRNTLGSSFIVGDDTLDMEPVKDEDCPYRGTVSIPRMIPVQFDSLGYLKLLAPWRKLVLEGLWKMTASKNPNHFYLIYLTVFMMLHEVSFNCADRKRRARENSLNRPYDLLKFVEEVQEGANIILSHWHYYKRDVNEMEIESEEKKKAVWGSLSSQETQLIVETRQAYKERAADRTLEPMTWEHDLMFVSQMFEENWEPKDTFRR